MLSDKTSLLFLGPKDSDLYAWLLTNEVSVLHSEDKIDEAYLTQNQVGFIVSYGYKNIISKAVLALMPNAAINLHISYLPWNRGAAPNFWSFVDDTPKGVSIHYIDEGLDTGDLIVQKKVLFESHETLRTSYFKLKQALENLFIENWSVIKSGKCERTPQSGIGSYHSLKDFEAQKNLLTQGWDTPVNQLKLTV